jgi:hypothetical protein
MAVLKVLKTGESTTITAIIDISKKSYKIIYRDNFVKAIKATQIIYRAPHA